MAQVKHIFLACLILLLCFISFFVVSKLSSTSFIREKSTVVDYEGVPNRVVEAEVGDGHKLFKRKCASCHALDKTLSGPALRGVLDRGPWAENRQNIYKWIKNPSAFMAKDPYTQELQKQYGSIMPSFEITDAQIESILKYIESPSPLPAVAMADR